MAHNCEVLLTGKQDMSKLMTTQHMQECFRNFPLQIQNKDTKNIDTSSDVDVGFQKVIPYLERVQ